MLAARISSHPHHQDRYLSGMRVEPLYSLIDSRSVRVALDDSDPRARQFGWADGEGRPGAIVRPESLEYRETSREIMIGTTPYRATPIEGIQDPDVLRAWRVERLAMPKYGEDKSPYDVALFADGRIECTCPDFVFRHQDNPTTGCKHIRKCRELGMFSAD